MTIDNRTEAERRCDAERSGELYVKPAGDDDTYTPLVGLGLAGGAIIN